MLTQTRAQLDTAMFTSTSCLYGRNSAGNMTPLVKSICPKPPKGGLLLYTRRQPGCFYTATLNYVVDGKRGTCKFARQLKGRGYRPKCLVPIRTTRLR